ncbi:MAG: TOBE domain-containing protein [Mailhella sp.]|nr:TOBE domain-containing protein [Mailhella sp.]
MKFSSRNAYTGTVSAIVNGSRGMEVEVTLPSGDKMYGSIPNAVAEKLGIEVGREAACLVKATEIMLAGETGDMLIGCRNQFEGKVVKLVRGFVNGEVLIETASGLEVNATVTLEGVNRLKIERGCTVTALFKSENVIIAVKK